MKSKPTCTITGDIHFTVNNLEVATSAVIQMLALSRKLGVPAVLNGDVTDGKSILRAEVANRLISILSDNKDVSVYANVGNHDKLSEKSNEHALHFLKPYARIVDEPTRVPALASWIIPYHSDQDALQQVLNEISPGSRIIVHQGVSTAKMGAYSIDKSSLPKECFGRFRTIGSHYHGRQDIECGRPRKGGVGLFSYVGSPYSQSWAEAGDGVKGFSILYSDGSLELVPTNLRRHLVFEWTTDNLSAQAWLESEARIAKPEDLVWIKVTGPRSELDKINKKSLGEQLFGHSNYKLDKIPTDSEPLAVSNVIRKDTEVLDAIIDNLAEPVEHRERLKKMWRTIL